MMQRLSKIFQPSLVIPKNAVTKNQELSKSQKLMIECGLIKHSENTGCFYLTPIMVRSLEKLTNLIDRHMQAVDGQKMILPTLTSAQLWQKSGRFESARTELMVFKDRHEKLQLLSPTHEESITHMLSTISPITYRNFPLRLYQITPKFRDEMKPRFGLIRAKEFLMKDLYTFDTDKKSAVETYDQIREQYCKLFTELEVPFVQIKADTGVMGGSMSHEFHILTSIGEDQIMSCKKCQLHVNRELCCEEGKICDKCSELEVRQGIEIGHAFVLGDKYTKSLKATFLSKTGKPEDLQMGCYGIGVTRLISACIEFLSSESEIRWPTPIAPFKTCLIPPKDGSKEAAVGSALMNDLIVALKSSNISEEDVLIDDRTNYTIGKRLGEIKKLGIPFIIILGSKINCDSPLIEFQDLNGNQIKELTLDELRIKIGNMQ